MTTNEVIMTTHKQTRYQMKESKLINAVNKAYKGVTPSGVHESFGKDEVSIVESAYKKIDSGEAVFFSHEEAKRLMKPTSIRLQPSLKVKVEAMAKKEGRSFNNMMTRILEDAVGNYNLEGGKL